MLYLKDILANELHKPIITQKFSKEKNNGRSGRLYRGADLADIQLVSRYNKGIIYN